MKIICIGRNYAEHAKELGNQIPEEPVIFLKPETALLPEGQAMKYPAFTSQLHYECELVVKIAVSATEVAVADAGSCYHEISLGIDFTARDIQDNLKKKGLPWEKAKAFDHAAAVGRFIPKENLPHPGDIHFYLNKNGQKVQDGRSALMLFPIDAIIAHVSLYFKLQPGDLIFTGTPAGVGPCVSGDRLEGYLENEKLLDVSLV